ncbi:30S ribosomal protein S9 [Candidatus Saccharibacteria bacterium]|nr:30S ribosomal protein S9 [Candidatus Saccharibacteria bacterium]
MSATKYSYGLGRRKSATASVRLIKGTGKITINGQTAEQYVSEDPSLLARLNEVLTLVQKEKSYDVTVVVRGGGTSGQVDAIRLGIAKALTTEAVDLRPVFKKAGLMKRDPREKERKKYGLRSARKKEQFSKR